MGYALPIAESPKSKALLRGVVERNEFRSTLEGLSRYTRFFLPSLTLPP